ncbi:hypothetical protein MMC09_005657 [Bachmanniomyces sp. S44760]|nr:hypothetical protein [Bachmanniomyces sp. S44760]
MAAAPASNPPALSEPKSSKKNKKAKNETVPNVSKPSAQSPTPEPEAGAAIVDIAGEGNDGQYESPYMKELYKNIRNVKKKLNATQKVDSIVAENPDKSLDDLLAARKINQDQKAQAQKKPALQASLVQLEEQISQYKQFDEDYQKRLATEKTALETAHKHEIEKVRNAALAEAKAERQKEAKDTLLILSKFLRAAAAKRQDGDEASEENKAFEGALLLVYGGDVNAVGAMEKLIEGSAEKVPSVDGQALDVTYKNVRDSAIEHAPPTYPSEETSAEEISQPEAPPLSGQSTVPAGSDPTVMHAGLTEIDGESEAMTNGASSHIETPTVPGASNIDAGAANSAAENNWDTKLSQSAESGPDGWVEVARDPAETDTGIAATPAAMSGTQSWAEDVPPPTHSPAPAATAGGDDFHEVHHHRGGRGRGGPYGEHRGGGRGGRGGFRGERGGEGGHRGRGGFRGDRGGEGGYRGRGRGGFRGRGRGDGPQPQ